MTALPLARIDITLPYKLRTLTKHYSFPVTSSVPSDSCMVYIFFGPDGEEVEIRERCTEPS